jgi:capsular exopolysaccharide synthesis family protein
LIESRSFLDQVALDLPYEMSGARLGESVHGEPVPDIGVLEMVARGPSPAVAQAMAQGVADEFVRQLADNGIVSIRTIDPARLPTRTVAPSPVLVLGVAVLVGLALGALAGLAWERTFGRVETSEDLTGASGLTVLGVLPEQRRLRRSRQLVVGNDQLYIVEENLRILRTNLLFAARDRPGGAILVTGLNPQDGKSTVAANLAVIIAELGISVLLIDGDVHRPVQHELFALSNDRGLTSTLLEDVEPSSLLQPTQYAGLQVVTAGPPLEGRSQELHLFLQQLPRFSSLAEVVLVDSPPLRADDDVRLLAAFSGTVMVLVRAGANSARQVREAIEGLRMLEAKLLGVVLTMAEGEGSVSAGEYYRYRRADGVAAPLVNERAKEPADERPALAYGGAEVVPEGPRPKRET